MGFELGNIVISKAGRDKGSFLAVVGTENRKSDIYVLTADGKERPLARPKSKNPKHLQKTDYKIDLEQLTDKKLRSFIRSLKDKSEIEEKGQA